MSTQIRPTESRSLSRKSQILKHSLALYAMSSLVIHWCAPAAANSARTEFQIPTESESLLVLKQQMKSLPEWTQSLNGQTWNFLCLGESHEAVARTLASEILSQLEFDSAVVEATETEVSNFLDLNRKGTVFQHLGADYAAVFGSLVSRLSPLQVHGVEASGEELAPDQDRDTQIATRIDRVLSKDKKTVALYGALHCAREDLGLGNSIPFYRHLESRESKSAMINATLVIPGPRTSPKLYGYLVKMDLPAGEYVIANGKDIDPYWYRYHTELVSLFRNFDHVIVHYTPPRTNLMHRLKREP